MENNYKVGDYVNIMFFELSGKIVSIESATNIHILDGDDFLLYKVRVEKDCFATVTEDCLSLVIPERVTDES